LLIPPLQFKSTIFQDSIGEIDAPIADVDVDAVFIFDLLGIMCMSRDNTIVTVV